MGNRGALNWESWEHRQMLNDPVCRQRCRPLTNVLACIASPVACLPSLFLSPVVSSIAWEVRKWDFPALHVPLRVLLRWHLSSVSSALSEKTKATGAWLWHTHMHCGLHFWSLSESGEMLFKAYSGILIIAVPVPRNIAVRLPGMEDKTRPSVALSSLGAFFVPIQYDPC